ncbi:class I glutamine amidotransferase-like protein [Bombardia bombarda]|uniref:Class I glutamine amidotransferase-like protein n=1 Tax=Bombardia bombarda TaxID=252184 RepID=A0AA40CFZ3_9PEZI|nr:class I glutamine amidotransferase-like protein [Bombardia bombarda]
MGSTPRPIRLAILETDTPIPSVSAKYDGYFGVFQSLFSRAVAPTPLDQILTLTRHDVVNDLNSYPALDAIDAILITGSRHNAFGDDDWITALVEFTRKALLTGGRVRVIGVCFGHQIVGRTMGVLVDRSDRGWEVSVTEIRLTEKGRELFGGRETLRIQQMHRDQVFALPAGAELLAETDVCPNQGFVVPGKVITVQGHPEFTDFIMEELLKARHATGLFTDDMFQSGLERNKQQADGELIASVFVKFLQQ